MAPSNGNIPASAMTRLPGFAPYAARANFRPVSAADDSDMVWSGIYTDCMNLQADFAAHFGTPLTYAEAYRSLEVQEWRKAEQAKGGPTAAAPGTSNHGYGLALDFRNNIGTKGSETSNWMIAHSENYGFYRDVAVEYWHYHHLLDYSVTKPRAVKKPTTSTASAGEINALVERAGMSTATITVNASNTQTVKKGAKKNAYGVSPRSRVPGNIVKGDVFVVDLGARTVYHERSAKVIGLGNTLNPSGKALAAGGDTIYAYLDAGFKALNF